MTFHGLLGRVPITMTLAQAPVKVNTDVAIDVHEQVSERPHTLTDLWVSASMQGMSMPDEIFRLQRTATGTFATKAVFVMPGTWTVVVHAREKLRSYEQTFNIVVTS